MIYIYEPFASGTLHIEFNKAFLLSMTNITNQIVYFGEKEQIAKLRRVEGLQQIDYRIVEIPNYDVASKKIHKIIREYKNLSFIKKEVGNDKLIITNGLPQTIMIANKLFKGKKVYIVMHGYLAAIQNNQQYKPWNMGYYVKKSLMKLNSTFKLIVLGNSIRDNFLSEIPNLKERVLSIDHPFLVKNLSEFSNKEYYENGRIKIGTIGVGTESRGILLLNELVDYVQKKNLPIEIYHVGKTTKDLREKLLPEVKLPFITENMIPEEEYLQEVNRLDFILYMHGKDSYKLTASGALFEAFSLAKPIITLKNDYFCYVMKKANKNVGYIVDDMEEIKTVLDQLPKVNKLDYDAMVENSKNTLNIFSPKVVGEQLREIIN
jgi:glycosyltransferase involved in cell wall biosynthesis